mmetsp:Transcript_22412/g.38172  ORF Transcript_22412/g.38172 Transcript_22412/m.38172 type:complete len:85 (-) Transcript_22412:559-813(-)
MDLRFAFVVLDLKWKAFDLVQNFMVPLANDALDVVHGPGGIAGCLGLGRLSNQSFAVLCESHVGWGRPLAHRIRQHLHTTVLPH